MDLNEATNLVRDKLGNRRLLFLTLSGSHAWGLERPDSDIDLRGVYLEPTMKLLGLGRDRDTVEFTEGLYDVQLYELEKFLGLLCKHNGNMVSLLWLPNPVVRTFYVPWAGLARSFMTKKLRNYYRGYAESQRKRAMSQRGGKALIYTYREIFSGLYVMRYGAMEHNFTILWQEALSNGWYHKGDLLESCFRDKREPITDEGWHKFYSEWKVLCEKLDEETKKSKLPDDYDGIPDCTKILQQLRIFDLYDQAYNLI